MQERNDPKTQRKDAAQTAETRAAGVDGTSTEAVPENPQELAVGYRQLLREKQEIYDRLLRKQAEVENFRKRIQREKEEFLQHATADLVRALLPTLDGFDRALNHRDPSVPEQFYKGMELIQKQLTDVLGRAGLTPIETEGKVFDPHLHQAVETVDSPGHRDNEVVEELQKGYKLKQRLLRPAIVKVAVAKHDAGARRQAESADGNRNSSEAGES